MTTRAALAAAILCVASLTASPAAAQQRALEPMEAATPHGYLGVELRDLSKREAKAHGLATPRGTFVRSVTPGSPAAKKLLHGDIIMNADKQPISDTAHFLAIIGGKAPGTTITLRVMRRGKVRSGTVTLGVTPDDSRTAPATTAATSVPKPIPLSETSSQATGEFMQHHRAWLENRAPEPRIAAMEAMLKLEPQVAAWPLPESREVWRSTIHESLATAYLARHDGARSETLEKALAIAEAGAALLNRDATPERWGMAQLILGKVLADRLRGNRSDNLERALAAYERAFTVFTRETFPQRWAETQNLTAVALRIRKRGDPQENATRAFAALEAALTIRTREAAPAEWAESYHNLAMLIRGSVQGDRAENIERSIAMFNEVLTVRTREAMPREWGATQHQLGNCHRQRQRGNKSDNEERAIAYFEAALLTRTREALPVDWAATQHNLGSVYTFRIKGDANGNIERAVAYLEAALTVRTREASPEEWASTQSSIAFAYEKRVNGDNAENQERVIGAYEAALTVYAADTHPKDWASNKHWLASAYERRTRGDRADNIERAIAAYEAALSVYDRKALPDIWALAQMSLGAAYTQRSRDNPAENAERALTAFEAAATAMSREKSPQQWYGLHSFLGNLYANRVRGERAENIERAIAAYETVLTHLTVWSEPKSWKEANLNLGMAYNARVHGDHAENVEKAITAFNKVLANSSKEKFPEEWAVCNYVLAIAYSARQHGSLEENTQRAIAAIEAARDFYSREAHPVQWARSQGLLGGLYARREDGDKQEHLKRAVAALEGALTVFTREATPSEWALAKSTLGILSASGRLGIRPEDTERGIAFIRDALSVYTAETSPQRYITAAGNLGVLYLRRHDWRSAYDALASARDAYFVEYGEGVNEVQARDLAGNDLFPAAAYAAAQLGDVERAFALLDEGKAQVMRTALKLTTLDISAEEQERLKALRKQIRQGEAAYEVLGGEEKMAKVAELGRLRSEVLALIMKGSAPAASQKDFLTRVAEAIPEGGALMAPLFIEGDRAHGLQDLMLFATLKNGKAHIRAIEVPQVDADHRDKLISAFKDFAKIHQPGTGQGSEPGDTSRQFGAALKRIGPLLWQPMGKMLVEELNREGVKLGASVVVLPLGAFGLIPFGLAQNPDNGRMLLDDYAIAYAPSIAALVSAKNRVSQMAAVPSLTAIVNPTGDLPFTPVESALVASRFDPGRQTVVAEQAATPEAAFAALKGTDYWHIASHGFFDMKRAMDSGLVLAGKRPLTVGALMKVDGLKGPRLAVLSACETGVYDAKQKANEFTGLPAAFLQLGTGGVVSSLWPVDDLSTALLMARFYEMHRSERRTPAQALSIAQVWLRDATVADLRNYARKAVQEGRLPRELADKLEAAMKQNVASRGLIESLSALIRGIAQADETDANSNALRPFGHPYYWSGFVLTGL